MPLADYTAIANLALSHIGEPAISDYESDTGETPVLLRLHLPQCVETVLESHLWSFAMRTAELVSEALDDVAASLQVIPHADGPFTVTATTAGSAGNAITFEITTTTGAFSTAKAIVAGVESAPLISFSGAGGDITVQDVITLINTTFENVSATLDTGSDGDTIVVSHDGLTDRPVAETNLAGGITALDIPPGWSTAWNLPDACLRLRQIDGTDIDRPEFVFEIQGRFLLLPFTPSDPPIVTYITSAPPVDEWPTTFTDAVAFLLASRIAPRLTQSPNIAADLFQKHEIALGKARSKDTRETRSAENNTPRHMAARSGLVTARYNSTHRPPY